MYDPSKNGIRYKNAYAELACFFSIPFATSCFTHLLWWPGIQCFDYVNLDFLSKVKKKKKKRNVNIHTWGESEKS